ncbi:TonB-dependent receptor [Pseudoalteromonas sp. NBT06-2]|uniref:TonB-dependent receptor n=1 Tax=Pseudoalteromonas sp. NBT06-2 TaxID=2025950 RepID=UPI000BA7B995|nr:TonB-dependent receptor [Pseudoalteromonas sp. NBT06-2]PAJ76281.1 TonB-dependent receptor [Pseudoalteromonas sp. NBT06-2]
MKPVTLRKHSKTLIALAVTHILLGQSVLAEEAKTEESSKKIEQIMVTANRHSQDIQEVSSSITVLGADDVERAGIIDITGLQQTVPGLKVGSSGGEVRPAMRGARTNEVGVAGTGIAEQIVGIFQDGIYVPTTTAGMGAFVDIERIEVLRGPQGTLYGRNTFAGSINVITNKPTMGEVEGGVKVTVGAYNRSAYEGILNLPLSDDLATRVVIASDRHDGYINNHFIPGPSDDLREKNQFYLRSVTRYEPSDDFNATFRVDYSNKDANSEAIWGYQQIAGYSLTETSPGSGVFSPNATVTPGHIYQPGDVQRDDIGPYDVYRNALSMDKQEAFSATAVFEWTGGDIAVKWTSNYSELSGKQFYDNDYSDGGLDFVGGFGRQDDQKTFSSELQLASNDDSPLQWITGIYYYDQEADWEWVWREDTTGNGTPDSLTIPSWGNPDYDPHEVESVAVFGQLRYEFSKDLRLVGGLRYNKDEKTFTGNNIPDWDDSAVLWKAAFEYDQSDDLMLYASAATGYRTGGANDARVVARGADPLYDNEDVISYEVGMKSSLLDGAMRLNISAFINEYEDVKAQLFAVACNDSTSGQTVLQCVEAGTNTGFEYYENGGNIDTLGVEIDMQWYPVDNLTLSGTLAWLDSEFSDDFAVGNSQLRPLLGLGNIEDRQDINDNNSQFSFAGWSPAMSPEYSLGFAATYEVDLGNDSYLIPHIQVNYSDAYYAFDLNIPETKVDAHAMIDARISWVVTENIQVDVFVKNLTDEAVLTRAVVHSQIVDSKPVNSVQANWNDPRTWGASLKYTF